MCTIPFRLLALKYRMMNLSNSIRADFDNVIFTFYHNNSSHFRQASVATDPCVQDE